jgi:hypothetical protein
MLAYPKTKASRRESNVSGRPTTTWGTVLTSDSVAHTEPATETELIAATDFDSYWVNVLFHTNFVTATVTDSLVNIKVGAAASEVTVIENLLAGWADSISGGASNRYGFPLRIPEGSRISATHRSVRTSAGVTCIIELIGGGAAPFWTGTRVESVGALTASSRGTQVTPGTTSDGTFTNLATNVGEFGFVLPRANGNADLSEVGGIYTLDIGANGVLLPGLEDFICGAGATETWYPKQCEGRFYYLPAGTDIEARMQASGAAEAKSVILYGVL